MMEPGGGGAFVGAGAGPSGVALVAADLSGVYLSDDGGRSWQVRGATEGIVFHTHASAVGFDPADESVMYLGTEGFLYRSADCGATFQPLVAENWSTTNRMGDFSLVRDPVAIARLHNELPAHRRLYWTAIAFSPSHPSIGYAAAHSAYDTLDAIILKTTDRGVSWRPIKAFRDQGAGGALVLDEDKRVVKILVDHGNPERVYFLSQADDYTEGKGRFGLGPQSNVRKSTDGGATWDVLAGSTPVTYTGGKRKLARYDAEGRQIVDPATGAAAVFDGTKAGESMTELALLRDVLDFELDPVDPNILYATKGSRSVRNEVAGAGTYKSTDGGATWARVDDKFGALKVKAVGADPTRTIVRRFDINGWEGSTPLASRKYPQVWESTDAGRTWTQKAGPAQFSFGAIDPHWYSVSGAYAKTIGGSMADPDVYYWADAQWVCRSDDGGASFRSASSNIVVKDNGEKWYATTGVSNVVSLTLKISEADPRIIFHGNSDIGLWRSLDNGATWQHANEPGYLSDWNGYGGQAQAIALDPERPNVAWAGLGGGYVDQVMVKSEAHGKLGTWRRSHSGLPLEKRKSSYQEGAALRGLSVDRTSPRDRRTLFVMADDKVFRSTDDGATWSEVFDPTGGQPFNYNGLRGGTTNADRQGATAVDPTDGRWVYAGGVGGLYRSSRGGDPGTWEKIGPPALVGVQKIVVSPSQPQRVAVAAYGTGLFLSEDRGQTWREALADRFVRGVALHPTNDRILFAASSNVFISGGRPDSRGVLLSTDGGDTWREMNAGLSWPFVRDVEFNPHDPSQVFIVTPGTSYHVGRFDFSEESGRLSNLSILTSLEAGDAFSVGTVIGGAATSGTKALLFRAAGPALGALGVTGVHADPKLELFAGSTRLGENDDWGASDALNAVFARVGAFSYGASNSKDAALYAPALSSGSHSMRISGASGASGTVIAEIYDATPASSSDPAMPRLINVSVLKRVGSGLTAGFTIDGPGARSVLIRAIGPSLAAFEVGDVLADPKLELFDGASRSLATNDNWGGGAALATAFTQVGAFALSPTSKDAALLIRLLPGSYSVRVDGGEGVALVEIYEVP